MDQFEYRITSSKEIVEDAARVPRWYRFRFAYYSAARIRELCSRRLNELGRDGWELIGAVRTGAWCDYF